MRLFPVAYDQEIDDKVFGGIFTIRQTIILATNLIVLYYLFSTNQAHVIKDINGEFVRLVIPILVIKIIISIGYLVVSLFFTFQKVDGYKLETHLMMKFNYKRRKKEYAYMKQFKD
jgi:hypothetical protein